jgi:hypothetical protein
VEKRVHKTPKPTTALWAQEKTLCYLALAEINSRFTQTVQSLGTLQDLKFLRGGVCSALRVALEETRCWVNVEVTEVLLQRETQDWGHYGRRRRHWEKRFEDPNDLRFEAARLKKSRP